MLCLGWSFLSKPHPELYLPFFFPCHLPMSHVKKHTSKNTNRCQNLYAMVFLVSGVCTYSHFYLEFSFPFFFSVYWTSTHTFRLNSNVTVPLKLPDMTFPVARCTPPCFSTVLFINQFYHFKHSIIILSWLLLHCIGISFKSRSYLIILFSGHKRRYDT